jgi:opine dehydrogenase
MRWIAPTLMRQTTQKRWVQLAAFPGSDSAAAHARIAPLFPQMVVAPDILHTGLANINAVFHVANCIANAGRIERGGGYLFYEGVTRAVANVYEAIDLERMEIAAALHVNVPNLVDWIERAYNVREADLVQTFHRLTNDADGPYVANKASATLDHKYITEDVPTGLIPIRELARAAGVATPTIDALVKVASLMTGRTFEPEARTLERMGLAGLNAPAIQEIVRKGFTV